MVYIEQGPATEEQQVQAVKEYANSKYSKGWDIVVEAMDTQEIAEQIKGSKTRWGAIERMGKLVKILHSHRQDIQGTAF